ncbi:MAG TPA: arginase family protein [Trueperaceae bacterium]|nr:arginase family protein [Trueperaceae bacterium]
MTSTDPPISASFLASTVETDLSRLEAGFAIVGIPFGVPYDIRGLASAATLAPQAVRERSSRYGAFREHHDFDSDREMLPRSVRVVDVGDVKADASDIPGNAARATATVKAILAGGAVPVVLGGDDSTPALAIAAFADHGPVTVVQIDAHLDYRDEVNGQRHGYSSPMRRAAEFLWVEKIVHVGIRGVGSARRADVDATLARGNDIVTAREVVENGIAAVLARVPEGGRYYVTVDVDGFDPAVMPGTSAASPGGLSFRHGLDLLTGLQERGTVVGMGFAEFYPDRDVNGITALGIVRLAVVTMATTGRGGRGPS